MEARSVGMARGWEWIVEAWGLFRKDPGTLILMFLVFLAVGIGLQLVPLVGHLAFTLISPALVGGYLYAGRQLEAGEEISAMDLFRAFQDRGRTGPMLTLGVIVIGLSAVVMFMFLIFVSGTMGLSGMEEPPAQMTPEMAAAALMGLLVLLALVLVLTLFVYFAIPLVMLRDVAPFAAIRLSLSACLRNVLPLILYSLVVTVLGIVALIPFGLGWFVLMPVMFLAQYRACQDIFPGDTPAATLPA